MESQGVERLEGQREERLEENGRLVGRLEEKVRLVGRLEGQKVGE